GDDLNGLALRAVLRLPLAPVEAAVDADRAALREVLRAALGLVAPDGDVEVVRLVAPLAGRGILLAGVHRDAELADGGAARRVAELRILGQVPDEHDAVDVGHYSSSCGAGSRAADELVFAPAYSRPPTSSRAAGAASSRGAEVREPSMWRTARWRMTPSVILRTRVISSSASAGASNTSR